MNVAAAVPNGEFCRKTSRGQAHGIFPPHQPTDTKTMRVFLRVLLIVILLFLCLFTGLHMFIRLKGREMVTHKMSAAFQSRVTVRSVSTGFPLHLIISDMEVAGWFKIKKVVAGLGLLDLFSDDFILSSLRLQGLQMTLEKRPQAPELSAAAETEAVQIPAKAETPAVPAGPPSSEQQHLPFPGRIAVRHFVIADAVVDFVDYSRQEQPIAVTLKKVNATVENIRWPMESSSVSFFSVSARVPFAAGAEEGKVAFEGWINPFRRDMRATLDIRDIDGIALYPYYREWIALEQDRIAKAKLNLVSNITSLNNDVDAACHLELTQIEFKPRQGEEAEHRIEKMIDAVIGLFKAVDQGKIVLDFTFKTKLDNPEFGLLGVIESALKAKVESVRKTGSATEQIINFPGKVLKGTVNGTADLTKALINGTVSVGKELKKAVEVSFAREGNATETAAENLTVLPINVAH